jgi:hypothetical protein
MMTGGLFEDETLKIWAGLKLKFGVYDTVLSKSATCLEIGDGALWVGDGALGVGVTGLWLTDATWTTFRQPP